MRSKKFLFIVVAILSATMFTLQSCNDEKFTVLVTSGDVSESAPPMDNLFEQVYDGNYQRIELSKEEWSGLHKGILRRSHDKYRWNENSLKEWLVSKGFAENEAAKESAWMASTNRCLIIFRNDDTINYVLK